MTTIRWGIVGCGDVTETKSGPALRKATGSALTAVMRRNGALAEDYARRHGVPHWTDDAETLIRHPEVDVVYVATPPSAHKDYTLLAAAAGKPVLVEKPMAPTVTDCEAMIDACAAAGVPLFVAYYRRAMPRFATVKRMIDDGTIGTPRHVQVTHTLPPPEPGFDAAGLPWRFDPAVNGGGLFVDMGSHVLDLLDHWFGPVADMAGDARNQAGLYPAEDIVTARFAFASGVVGVGSWCYTTDQSTDRITVTGSHGRISVSGFDQTPIVLTTNAGVREIEAPYPQHAHQPFVQTIVDQLSGHGTCPCTGRDALRTTRVIAEILAGYAPPAR